MTHILKSISQRFLGSQHFPAGINQFTFTIDKISNETIEDYKSIKKERKKNHYGGGFKGKKGVFA